MSAFHSSVHQEMFPTVARTRDSPVDRLDGEYTEGETKKNRPKARCLAIDDCDTIKMRTEASQGNYAE